MAGLSSIDRRAATWGVIAVLVAVAIAILGSGNLRWFDAALVGYLFGSLFAIFAVAFWMLAVERIILGILNKGNDIYGFVYLIRFVAFSLIIWAVVDKNRSKDRF